MFNNQKLTAVYLLHVTLLDKKKKSIFLFSYSNQISATVVTCHDCFDTDRPSSSLSSTFLIRWGFALLPYKLLSRCTE